MTIQEIENLTDPALESKLSEKMAQGLDENDEETRLLSVEFNRRQAE